MPSKHRAADRETFPRLQEELGEDPARFLDQPLFDGGDHTSSPGAMMRARIRGIDHLATLRAWKAVERNLDRGPRDRVMELLEDREEYLQQHGDRDKRTTESDHERPPKDVYVVEDGERIPSDEYEYADTAIAKATSTSTEVATDGGES